MKLCDPRQPADHVRQMRAEHPPVGVQLIDDHVLEIREQAGPIRVMRHDSRVKHVGVGQQNPGPFPRRTTRIGRGVAIIRDGTHLKLGVAHEPPKRLFLVPRQRLGRE
jgi:hypothetical protein